MERRTRPEPKKPRPVRRSVFHFPKDDFRWSHNVHSVQKFFGGDCNIAHWTFDQLIEAVKFINNYSRQQQMSNASEQDYIADIVERIKSGELDPTKPVAEQDGEAPALDQLKQLSGKQLAAMKKALNLPDDADLQQMKDQHYK